MERGSKCSMFFYTCLVGKIRVDASKGNYVALWMCHVCRMCHCIGLNDYDMRYYDM